jgi:hypothetical protein
MGTGGEVSGLRVVIYLKSPNVYAQGNGRWETDGSGFTFEPDQMNPVVFVSGDDGSIEASNTMTAWARDAAVVFVPNENIALQMALMEPEQ